MEAATRRFNELLAAKVGIEQIEALHDADIVSRKLLGLISQRQKLATNAKNLNDYTSIHFNLECIYLEINSLINRLCPKILEDHSRRLNVIMADLLIGNDLQESKRTIARDIFPGIPKNLVLEIIRNRNIPQRIMQKMSRTRMNPTAVAQLIAIQKDPLIRSAMVTQYFQTMRNNAYMIARTAISSMMGQVARNTYSSLPKELVGFQIHAILDSRTRPAHRERDKTVYYKNPRYDNLGFDQMPNPPLEADGSTAFNCRCWLTPILNTEPTKFYDFKGRIIPDAKTFSQWFGSSTKDKQVLAIGVKRHQMASKRLKKGETLQWWHLLDPDSGMLLDLDEIKSESPQKRAGRIKKAKNIIFKA